MTCQTCNEAKDITGHNGWDRPVNMIDISGRVWCSDCLSLYHRWQNGHSCRPFDEWIRRVFQWKHRQ